MTTVGIPAIRSQKPIYVHNAFVVRQEIRYYDPISDRYEPYVGGSLQVRFSTEADGYDSLGVPSTLFGPYALAEASEDGEYYHIVSADIVTQYLASLVGQVVYQVVEGNQGATYYDLTNVQPLLVVDPLAPLIQ